MREKEIQFGTAPKIFGTIMYPSLADEKKPAILLIPGSGPIDRNGNGKKKNQKLNVYNQLAHFLTENGFITLRFDKRGTGKSNASFIEAGFWDLVADGRAAVDVLKQQQEVDSNKIFILGHSEGCMLAPEIAKGNDIAGLILVAGAAQSMHEAMIFQREQSVKELQNIKGFKGKLISLLKVPQKAAKQGQKFDEKVLKSEKDVIRYQGIKINAKWFREHFQYNVKSGLEDVECPILAITGSRDVQAQPEKVFEIAQYTNVETDAVIVEGMNHMLRDQEEDLGILQIKRVYKDVGNQPLSKELLDSLKKWLTQHV
ncbi:alpha/beta hydrolase family protein [Halalkalibacter akibai]|uniref:Serine aminopeptidase S33 domain-containing protein n=1 Tax=Halalkalibacter akibai (strain ATCC 43226 / DSM 21942 / CIP 109018 / JCM 9157 / 1139) TaxID=1236973 RepID=W4QX86_HALA3|nr:alpha/beta fold hydrolase [Halalkalibacter akibai]GAE36263.1 hypothetical protein JCM9157_3422 [Halalkalibacter akibai JCM 9157]